MVRADRRLYPRVKTNLGVKIGVSVDITGARIVDISLGGVSIQGNFELAAVLKLDPEDPQGCGCDYRVSFDLPYKQFSVLCRLVHVRRLSQNDYLFGLKFLSLNEADSVSLASYINSCGH